MELGGWKSAEMVIRYAHVNTSHLAPTIGKLWAAPGAVDPVRATGTDGE